MEYVMVITYGSDRVSHLFDKVLVLAKSEIDDSGHLAFFGFISEAMEFFSAESLEEVVWCINRKDESGDGYSDYYIRKFEKRREHRSGLHISSYVVAHMFFEMFLCFVEGIIVTTVLCIANAGRLPDTGVLLAAIPELAITLFLTIFSADMLGLMVSCMVKKPNTAMTVMPFILILQLVMSGMIFELTGITEQIAKLTISKWSMNAIISLKLVDYDKR